MNRIFTFSHRDIHGIAMTYQTLCDMLWINNESIQELKALFWRQKHKELFLSTDTNGSTGSQKMLLWNRMEDLKLCTLVKFSQIKLI